MVLLYQEVQMHVLKYGKIKNNNNYLIFEVKYLIILIGLLNVIKFKKYLLKYYINYDNSL